MSLLALAGTNSATGGYEIDNSIKLEDDNDEFLTRTNASGTNRKTWTVSVWFKQTELASMRNSYTEIWDGGVFGEGTRMGMDNTDRFWIDIGGGTGNTGTNYRNFSTLKLRDTSAWYHLVVALDTTQSTAANRLKVWLNGTEITAWDQQQIPAQNYQCAVEAGVTMTWGAYNATYHGFSGYLAECNYVDGVTATQNDFGEYDEDSGIWKPKEYTGSYGTNGSYLDFEIANDLGANAKGNDVNFSLNNITSANQATDTPTNNFCTLNPLYNYAYGNTITEGATKIYGAANNWGGGKAAFGLTSGKWYWEIKQLANGNTFMGIQTDGEDNISSGNAHSQNTTVCFYTDGTIQYSNGSETSTSAANSIAANSIVGFALDLDSATQTIKVYNNNSLVTAFGSSGTANLSTYNIADKTVFPFVALYDRTVNMNFGGYTVSSISSPQSDANGYGNFEYSPPSGYYALCTKNLEEYG